MKIFKYPLEPVGRDTTLYLPRNSELLTIQFQRGVPTLWAMVDETQEIVDCVVITCFGTGWDIPDNYTGTYLFTIQDAGGYVWHYFYEFTDG